MKKYVVEVRIELEAGNEEAAYEEVSEILKETHDAYRNLDREGRHPGWDYSLLEGCVTEAFDPTATT